MFRANAEGLKIIWIDRRLIPGSGNRWGAKDPPDRSKNQTLFSEFLSVIGFVVSVDTLFAVIPEQVQPHVCTPLQPGTLGAFLQLCQSISLGLGHLCQSHGPGAGSGPPVGSEK
ncbi:uncharacterized protein LOC112152246 isoform X3 [Oryzias melastigma]|uniref:uncharacterized protein LOC112152246 isoform X3 n=1 Tax=Oryzias melastigma TaxID=30732 RepID=UPI000CF81B96|nr:uncharacterized protein LOC112152246 isoform X3 [Oryzias melastigma]